MDLFDGAPTSSSMKSTTIVVAGRSVQNAAERICDYLLRHDGTVAHYDLLVGSFDDTITIEVIKATRKPWMNSRISNAEAAWVMERGKTAPWSLVPADADLRDADPSIERGLYDDATELWDHFRKPALSGFADAKVSKILHLMRPALIPILDSRLLDSYKRDATIAASAITEARPERATKTNYWEAIRQDLVIATDALVESRRQIKEAEVQGASDVIDRLTDLRLLDMLTWVPLD